MPELVNITSATPKAVQIWGFHGPCSVRDVAAALLTIGRSLSGQGNSINIMSGTHGFCSGAIGAVASREQKFAEEDLALAAPTTKDKHPITLNVIDFNTLAPSASRNRVAEAMALLNQQIRGTAAKDPQLQTFLLAYCCSAGEKLP